MSKNSRETEAQGRLISQFLDGLLDEERARQFVEQCTEDERLRDAYLRSAKLDAMLKWSHGAAGYKCLDNVDPIAIAELLAQADIAARKEQEELAAIQERLDSARREHRREIELAELHKRRSYQTASVPYGVVLLCGTAIAASLWMVLFFSPAAVPEVAEVEQPNAATPSPPVMPAMVATILGSVDARWRNESIDIKPGTRLLSVPHKLDEGLVQIRMDDGAVLVVEAPTEFELVASNRANLKVGRVVGDVPPEAIGFTIETPSSIIVDLGTEFGVQVSRGDDVRVDVFSGEVTATAGVTGEAYSILEGEAIHVASETHEITTRSIGETKFVRRLPATIKFVGLHEGIGEHLRTTSVAKPLDADGDNVFGTSGYYFFNSNDAPKIVDYVAPFDNLIFNKPAFVASRPEFENGIAAAKGVYSIHGMPGYLDIDDPRLKSGAEVGNINSGVLSYSCHSGRSTKGPGNLQRAGSGSEIELCNLLVGDNMPAAGFRLGLFVDNGDIIDTVPRSIRVSVDGAEHKVDVESSDLDGDLYCFDIEHAAPGDIVTIYLQIGESAFASIGGITFDVPQQ